MRAADARPDPAVVRAVLAGSLARNRVRLAIAVLAIALGVALGFAVQLINHAAVNELSSSVRALAGDADLEIRGPRGGFDESVYATVAARDEVAVASPIVEVDAKVVGRDATLRVVGRDVFQAGYVQPALIARARDRLDALRPDTVFLSTAAAQWLGLSEGDTLVLQGGLADVPLRVAGMIAGGGGQRLAVVDIAAAQVAFGRLGRLSRIDLRLRAGVDPERFRAALAAQLPAGVAVARPETAVRATESLSRSYRVNLNVLALVALFTGGLLVFSTQTLAVVRRRAEFALLRVLGLARRSLVGLVLAEGAVLGVAGSAAGLLLGYLLAQAAVEFAGGDLGSGYFRGVVPTVGIEPVSLAIFFALGVIAAVLGSLAPALEAARAAPARALKPGDEETVFTRLSPAAPGLLLIAAGAVATAMPAVNGLPIAGYVAIALLLIGTLMLLPRVTAALLGRLRSPRSAPAALALAQLRGAPGKVTVSLAAIVASVSLMVSMAIMVASFRDSLEAWLDTILPADVYFRSAGSGDAAFVGASEQARIAALPGVRHVEFLREEQLLIDPARPRVVLLARPIDPSQAVKTIPLVVAGIVPAPDAPPPIWANEAMADLYGFTQGRVVELPMGGRLQRFTVAGVWRDYSRPQGAIVIARDRYVALTGDRTVTNGAIWLAPGATATAVRDALAREVPGGERLDVAVPGEIRALSLKAFDRTFAVTYALEFAAVAIGLVGLSSSFGALVLARRREFGMLRHLGMTRRQIGAMLATEGALIASIGLAIGVTLGALISLVLIHVVNRQSFHWGMETSWPVGTLVAFGATILLLATLTAVASGRQAMSVDAVRAVRDDW